MILQSFSNIRQKKNKSNWKFNPSYRSLKWIVLEDLGATPYYLIESVLKKCSGTRTPYTLYLSCRVTTWLISAKNKASLTSMLTLFQYLVKQLTRIEDHTEVSLRLVF